jgi:hypothetical protein
VSVDQPGHEHFSLAVEGSPGREIAAQITLRTNGHDRIAPDRNGSGLIQIEIFVHCQDYGVGQKQVNSLCHSNSLDLAAKSNPAVKC